MRELLYSDGYTVFLFRCVGALGGGGRRYVTRAQVDINTTDRRKKAGYRREDSWVTDGGPGCRWVAVYILQGVIKEKEREIEK